MKTRQGFVSNSSSSSFVVRGFLIKKKKLAKALGIELTEDWDGLRVEVEKRTKNFLTVEDTRDYFDGAETDDCVVGKESGELNDGVVAELDEPTEQSDIEIVEKAASIGIEAGKLRTYVQFIGNDNY